MLSTPPVCISNSLPKYLKDIAEHSICHPGNPSPHLLGHLRVRPFSADFHNVKSCGWCLFSSSSVLNPVIKLL